jgi:hypothetical protein
MHSNNKAYNLVVALPQDMSAIWKFTGLGGASASTRHFCSYCACHCELRGMPSLETCLDCKRLYPNGERVCHHHTFVEGKSHYAAGHMQDARDSHTAVQTICHKLEALLKTAPNHLTDVRPRLAESVQGAVGILATSDLTSALQIPALLLSALTASNACLAPCTAAITAARAQATAARDPSSTLQEIAALATAAELLMPPAIHCAHLAECAARALAVAVDTAYEEEIPEYEEEVDKFFEVALKGAEAAAKSAVGVYVAVQGLVICRQGRSGCNGSP